MSKDADTVLDENTRRYYLDAMGIQCWELLDSEAGTAPDSSIEIGQDATESAGFQQLEASVQQCDKCSLHANRKQAISGRGNRSADLMFVLLAPDGADDAAGVLCSGEAETLFTKMLAAINVAIDDVYITSLLKCKVPDLHTVSTSEISHCKDYLKQQVSLVQPRLIIVLGDTAARCLLQNDSPIDELRALVNTDKMNDEAGTTLAANLFESIPLIVSYSPQELVVQPENKRKTWQDLQQIQQKIEG